MQELATLWGNFLGMTNILEEVVLKALLIVLIYNLIKNPQRWGFRSSKDKNSN